jgi:hypothetical protein
MTKNTKFSCLILILLLSLVLKTGFAQISIDQNEFSANGRHLAEIVVTKPGMYHIVAESGQGSRLELIDRMKGIIAASGSEGNIDGKIDVILDIGTYRLAVYSVKNGLGNVNIKVSNFQNQQAVKNITEFPQLQAYQMVTAELYPFQQYSVWINNTERKQFNLEAMGRSLNTCLLWKNGLWLSEVKPSRNTYEAKIGQPMTYVEFHQTLNPGLYLLTCYGTTPNKWAVESSKQPLYLRMGIPQLPETGMEKLTISPFGRDVYLASKNTNFFQVSRDQKKDTNLNIHSYRDNQSRFKRGYRNSHSKISKKSKFPWCQIKTRDRQTQVVVLQAQPGDTLRLRYLNNRIKDTFNKKKGRYWISTLESVEGLDNLELTPFLLDNNKLVNAQIPQVGFKDFIKRKMNLFGKSQIWVLVQNEGKYQIIENQKFPGQGRYFLYNNRNKKVRSISGDQKNQYVLKKGYYSLSISPEKPGILEFVMGHLSLEDQSDVLFDPLQADVKSKVPPSFILSDLNIKYSNRTKFEINQRFSVSVGIINRKLPLNLTESLPVYLNANQEVLIRFDAKEDEQLLVTPNRSGQFDLKLDGVPIQSGEDIAKGSHELLLRNRGIQKDIFIVETIAQNVNILDLDQIAEQIKTKDQYADLVLDQVNYQHFERLESKSFRLVITEPGIYRLETLGLLAMRLNVRTKTITEMFTGEANGNGRNALIQQYLKSGIYYLTAQTIGKSLGKAGIVVAKSVSKNMPFLVPGGIDRQTVKPNEAVIYPIQIKKSGTYQIQTLGLQKTFQVRFDDSLGWPLVKPGQPGSIKQHLEPGIYDYYLLPSALRSKRITSVFRVMGTEKQAKNQNPKVIQLNQRISAVWRETEDRQEDRYELDIPAELDIHFSLSKNFEVNILQDNSDFQYSFRNYGLKPRIETLKPGRYFLYVNSIEVNDKVPYELLLTAPGQLAPGLSQNVSSFPTKLNVSLAEDAIVDFSGFGLSDTSARLWAKDEEDEWQLIANNDDRESDWNFLISSFLKAGTYQLEINLESAQNNETLVVMDTRAIIEEMQQSIPFLFKEDMGNEVIEIPFTITEDGVVRFVNNSGSVVKLQVLKDEQKLAESLDNLYIPLKAGQQYALRINRLNTRHDPIQVNATLLKTQSQDLLLGQESRFKIINSDETALRITALGAYSYYFKGRPAYYYCAYEFEKNCGYYPSQLFYFDDGNGWVIPADSDLTSDIAVTPFQIDHFEKIDLQLSNIPMLFNVTGTPDHLTVLEVESIDHQIGINLNSSQNEPPDNINWSQMRMGNNKTMVATDAKETVTVKIWTTDKVTDSVKLGLLMKSIPIVDQYDITSFNNNLQNQLLPVSAHLIEVNRSPIWIKVILQKGLKLVKIKDGVPTKIIAAKNNNQVAMIKLDNEKIYIYNSTNHNKIYRLKEQYHQFSDAAEVSISALNPGFAAYFESAGNLHLNIEELVLGDRVYIDGDVSSCVLFGQDGIIGKCSIGEKGNKFSPGILSINHEKGLVKVWMGGGFNDYKSQLGKLAAPSKSLLLNHGIGTLGNETELWELSLAKPQLVVIRHTVGGVTYIQKGKEIVAGKTAKNTIGRQVVHYLDAGDYQIITKPLLGLFQSGKMTVNQYSPEPLLETENLPLKKLLPPDEFHLFTIDLGQISQIGVGVQTASDNIAAQLYDEDFKIINEGPLMFNQLESGRYILMLHSVNTEAPILYQPLLYGSNGSDQGIPQSVIEGYIE